MNSEEMMKAARVLRDLAETNCKLAGQIEEAARNRTCKAKLWEAEQDIAALRAALREAMEYVESDDGIRGDLVGCQMDGRKHDEFMGLAKEPA